MSRKANHYVDNKAFLEAFKCYLPVALPIKAKWLKECKKLLAKGVKKEDLPKFERPRTSDYEFIGECLLKIAEHLSYKPNFINYTFREEMVGDAIENAIKYLENFDPEKSNNPFAYFTQLMGYAFLRRIAKEEEHSYIRQKSLEGAMEFFSTQTGDDGGYKNTYIDFIRENKSDIVKNFEEKKRAKKKESTRTRKRIEDPGIEKFMVPVDPLPIEL
jgi:hypothetical protein